MRGEDPGALEVNSLETRFAGLSSEGDCAALCASDFARGQSPATLAPREGFFPKTRFPGKMISIYLRPRAANSPEGLFAAEAANSAGVLCLCLCLWMGGEFLRFPLFVDLAGRLAVVIGGGTVGGRRAEALVRFGAAVTVVAPVVKEELAGVQYLLRGYREGDLQGAFLAVAAADDRGVNRAVFEEARRLGVWVNVCDCPEECDFFFPALCETGGVVAGVAGDGKDHHMTARAAAIIRRAWEEEL